jgi:hypothetical protein
MGEAFVALDGPSPEAEIARDLFKRGLIVSPVLIVAFGLIYGLDGAFSTAYAIAIVLVNFAVAAALDAWGARISVGMLMAMSMFGFFIRMAIVFGAFFAAKDAGWMAVIPFAFTLVITHLGLLFWEMKYVSANLAHPALKPKAAPPADAPAADRAAPAQKEF